MFDFGSPELILKRLHEGVVQKSVGNPSDAAGLLASFF